MKKYASFALKWVAVLLIFAFLFYRASQGDMVEKLVDREKSWSLLTLGFVLGLIATIITMIRWNWLTRALGVPLSGKEAIRLGFIGYVFNFSPAGIVGGDLVKGVLLARQSPDYKAACAVSVIVDRVVGLYAMFLIGLAAVGISGFWKETAPAAIFGSRAIFWLTVVSTAGIAILLIPESSNGRRGRFLRKIPLIGKICGKLYEATALYRNKKKTLLASLLVTFIVHFLFALSLWAFAKGLFQFAPSPGDHLILYPIANIGSMVPLSAGPLEYFLDELYPLFPIPGFESYGPGFGMMVGVAYRLATIVIALLGGVYYLTSRSEISRALAEIQEDETAKPEKTTDDVIIDTNAEAKRETR